MSKIRIGMVGGGHGGFIGAIHRHAMALDGRYGLEAGALSSDPARAKASAEALGIERSYDSYARMAQEEAHRSDGIQAVAIVTPNHLHFPIASAFLAAGIHVICDKPLTSLLSDAIALEALASRSSARFVLTHTYAGYQMVREARRLVADGSLGTIRHVQVEYVQDWLAASSGGKQAEWRTDPARSGEGGAIADIGTHAAHLARFVTGLEIEAVAADLTAFVTGRKVDDNANVLLRFAGGAKGMLWATQMAPGFENEVAIRVIGDKGSLEWSQSDLNKLRLTPIGEPTRIFSRGAAGFRGMARAPAGHPEGFIEAFATLYRDAADLITGGEQEIATLPGIEDGVAGMRFISACVASARANSAWCNLSSVDDLPVTPSTCQNA